MILEPWKLFREELLYSQVATDVIFAHASTRLNLPYRSIEDGYDCVTHKILHSREALLAFGAASLLHFFHI